VPELAWVSGRERSGGTWLTSRTWKAARTVSQCRAGRAVLISRVAKTKFTKGRFYASGRSGVPSANRLFTNCLLPMTASTAIRRSRAASDFTT
jgi:hypothetical protein